MDGRLRIRPYFYGNETKKPAFVGKNNTSMFKETVRFAKTLQKWGVDMCWNFLHRFLEIPHIRIGGIF